MVFGNKVVPAIFFDLLRFENLCSITRKILPSLLYLKLRELEVRSRVEIREMGAEEEVSDKGKVWTGHLLT